MKSKGDEVDELKAYFVSVNDDPTDGGVGVIARSYWEAKKIGAKESQDNPKDVLCRVVKNADLKGAKVGILGTWEGMKRHVYGWCEDAVCPKCKRAGETIYSREVDGKQFISCDDCYDKAESIGLEPIKK